MSLKSKITRINEVGIFNAVIGRLKRRYCRKIQEKFNIDQWHAIPYEHKEYAVKIVNYLNKLLRGSEEIVEIGCGTGDIIRRLRGRKLFGYDIDEKVIACARTLDKKHKVSFYTGSFDDIGYGRDIDYFITLGFMHGEDESFWRPHYQKISQNNNIHYFVVDVYKEENSINTHCLDFSKILPDAYKLIHVIKTNGGVKTIFVFEKCSAV